MSTPIFAENLSANGNNKVNWQILALFLYLPGSYDRYADSTTTVFLVATSAGCYIFCQGNGPALNSLLK